MSVRQGHDRVILKSSKRKFEMRQLCHGVPASLEKVLQPARGAELGNHVSGERWLCYPSGDFSCAVTVSLRLLHASSRLRRQIHA